MFVFFAIGWLNKKCEYCGEYFSKKYPSLTKNSRFCSKPCRFNSRKMTYEECKEAVSKLTYHNELQGTSLISVMKKNGWWDDLTSNLIRVRNDEGFSKEEIQKEGIDKVSKNYQVLINFMQSELKW